MYSIDANIFIYASDGDSEFHERARAFLNDAAKKTEPIFLCWEVIHAYLRITTNKTVYQQPLNYDIAYKRMHAFINLAHVQMLSASAESFSLLGVYGRQMKLSGRLITDAVIASQLAANGISRIYSNDSDFKKFDFLKVTNPLK